MTEQDIPERLAGVSIRPSSAARERAVTAAREVPARRPSRSGATLRIAAVALLLALFIGLTPPGRSLAEAVENLVGIGDEPTVPAAGILDKKSQSVIGVGEAPNGARYELVRGSESPHAGDSQTSCYYVSFPELSDPPRAFNCLTRAALQGLSGSVPLQVFAMPSSGELGPGGALTVMGSTAGSVASVDIEYVGADGAPLTTEPELAPLDAAKAFVAFLPFEQPDLEPVPSGDVVKQHEAEMANADLYADALKSIQITARDQEGQVVDTITLGDIPNVGYSFGLEDERPPSP